MKKKIIICIVVVFITLILGVSGYLLLKNNIKDEKTYYSLDDIETIEYRWKDKMFVIADVTKYYNKFDGYSTALLLKIKPYKDKYELLKLFKPCKYNEVKKLMKYYKNYLYVFGCSRPGYIDLESGNYEIKELNLNLPQGLIRGIIDINDVNDNDVTMSVLYQDRNKGKGNLKCNLDGSGCVEL